MTEPTSQTDETKKEKTKKSLIAKVSEVLMILTLLGGLGFFTQPDGMQKFVQFLVVPGIFFAVSVIYNLPIIGTYLASVISFLDGIGVNGIPAIALALLVVVAILNIATGEKILSDIVKLVSGFTTGTFAQKAASNSKSKKSK